MSKARSRFRQLYGTSISAISKLHRHLRKPVKVPLGAGEKNCDRANWSAHLQLNILPTFEGIPDT
ncbi:MAG TPA: hypothetical protein V6C90_02570 [Coleofasciculaceae cyanobacterium]